MSKTSLLLSDRIPKGFEKYGDKKETKANTESPNKEETKPSTESPNKEEKKPFDFKGFNFGGGGSGGGNKDNRF